MAGKYLPIYLNDHLTAATAAIELAKRVAGSNAGDPFGDYATGLVDELTAEREALRELMRATGAKEDHLKRAAGFLGEKLGRLKLNGEILGYSPLSRLVEVEGLILLATKSATLWRSIGEAGHDAGEWAQRAEARILALDTHRAAAAAKTLG